jgi:hypothetical protein
MVPSFGALSTGHAAAVMALRLVDVGTRMLTLVDTASQFGAMTYWALLLPEVAVNACLLTNNRLSRSVGVRVLLKRYAATLLSCATLLWYMVAAMPIVGWAKQWSDVPGAHNSASYFAVSRALLELVCFALVAANCAADGAVVRVVGVAVLATALVAKYATFAVAWFRLPPLVPPQAMRGGVLLPAAAIAGARANSRRGGVDLEGTIPVPAGGVSMRAIPVTVGTFG